MKHNCLICDKKLTSQRALSTHIRVHKVSIYEYKKRFEMSGIMI